MSSMLPFLSDEEILQIVSPLTQPAAIMRWFRNHGFPTAQQRPNGMPLIGREYFNLVTGGLQDQSTTAPAKIGPGPDVEGYLRKFACSAKTSTRAAKV